MLDLICNTLRLGGYDIIALSDPLKALDHQGKGNSPIDLLLTDIAMKPISAKRKMLKPLSLVSEHPSRHRHGTHAVVFTHEVDDAPASIPLLDMFERQRRRFGPARTAAQKYG